MGQYQTSGGEQPSDFHNSRPTTPSRDSNPPPSAPPVQNTNTNTASSSASASSQSATFVRPEPPAHKSELNALTVSELRERLRMLRCDPVKVRQCIEKYELVDLLYDELGGGTESCDICYAENVKPVAMPCCRPNTNSGTPSSSAAAAVSTSPSDGSDEKEDKSGGGLHYCRRCVEALCTSTTPQGRIGQCPTCRRNIMLLSDGNVVNGDSIPHQTCAMCRQPRVLVSQRFCEACMLGREFAFTYECERCSGFQRIPHPMWLYQAGPREFCDNTWACHVGAHRGCTYQKWRIRAEDVEFIPPQHCPPSWGRRDEWLAEVRERRQQERVSWSSWLQRPQ